MTRKLGKRVVASRHHSGGAGPFHYPQREGRRNYFGSASTPRRGSAMPVDLSRARERREHAGAFARALEALRLRRAA